MGGVALAVILTAHAKAEGVQVGEKAPSFAAVATDGQTITLEGTKGAEAVVLCFTCNNCPVAVAYEDRFIEFTKKYADKGVKFVAINVNVTENLEAMKKRAEEKQFNFPYAYDESGKSAAAYGARVTPHLFVIDGDGVVAYIGSFDDKMDAREVQEHYVAAAVDALLKGDKPEKTETKAFGCSIKR
jgi:peroxiredoxin